MGDTTPDNDTTGQDAAGATTPDTGNQTQQADSKPADDGKTVDHAKALEEMQKQIIELRKEAAKYRTERNQLRDKQAENLSESDRIAALEKALAESKLNATKQAIANTVNVPAELIAGSTPEEMQESAEALAALIKERVDAAVEEAGKKGNFGPRVPGEGKNGGVKPGGDWLSQALRGR